jgi:hypothetical protein
MLVWGPQRRQPIRIWTKDPGTSGDSGPGWPGVPRAMIDPTVWHVVHDLARRIGAPCPRCRGRTRPGSAPRAAGPGTGNPDRGRMRLWECACRPRPVKVRVSSDDIHATCNICHTAFTRKTCGKVLDHAATGLRDEVEGARLRDLGDAPAAVPPSTKTQVVQRVRVIFAHGGRARLTVPDQRQRQTSISAGRISGTRTASWRTWDRTRASK